MTTNPPCGAPAPHGHYRPRRHRPLGNIHHAQVHPATINGCPKVAAGSPNALPAMAGAHGMLLAAGLAGALGATGFVVTCGPAGVMHLVRHHHVARHMDPPPTPVPEPSSAAVFLLAVPLVALLRQRKRLKIHE